MITLRPYQEEAVQSVFTYYEEGKDGNPVIAMPTATGKSLVIAEFVKRTMYLYPHTRFMMLTHVKELIEQNANKLRDIWPNAPMGIYSAGLKQRNTMFPIIFGGVKSVVNCVCLFGHRDLLIIDEAHLLSPSDDTNYQEVIKQLKQVNPNLKVIGLTATPYRLKQGLITDGGIFTDFCFDNTSMEAYNQLIADGYLALLVPKKTDVELDLESVGMSNDGDFSKAELQAAVDKDKVTYEACQEMVAGAADRMAWIVFSSGVKHADHISMMLNSMGIDSVSVHSKMPADEATRRLSEFKAGRHQCAVNYGKLTTGFDYPRIDFIGMLRPTMSPGLWVQMLGRGARPSPETFKADCLVMDFARNTLRLGPVNDPVIPRRKIKGDPGVPPVKICPACGMYNHARAAFCASCNFEFPKQQKLTTTADTAVLVRKAEPQIETFNVSRTLYLEYNKDGMPPMIKVQYICTGGIRTYNEYVGLEHPIKSIKTKAQKWWMMRSGSGDVPKTTREALQQLAKLREPKMVRVWTNNKYPTIMGCEY